MTVREWLGVARVRLAVIGAPGIEAELLLAHVLGTDRTWLFAHPEVDVPDLAAEAILQRREHREPLAYILGYREFYSRRFAVDRRVLIPRHETEVLVETALAEPGGRVLDVATGSGCIGIALKLERPAWQVTLTDISRPALEVAEQNAADLGADVTIVESDLLDALVGESFDLIVSNPPYLADAETVEEELQFEPSAALYAGPRGDEFYRRLAESGRSHLRAGGALMVEIGYRQAGAVTNLFVANGWYVEPVIRDLDGNDRVIVAR